MAENKRHSVAGKVATPKVAPAAGSAHQSVPDTLEALSKCFGSRIKLTLAAPQSQTLEGVLYTADPIVNVVIVNSRATSPNAASNATQVGDFHVIPISRIQSFSVSPTTEKHGHAALHGQPAIGSVDTKQAKAREEAKIAKMKEEERHRGKGVSAEGQAIYDSFKRINMPVRWHNQEMIVHEAVIIGPPYQVENCKGPKEKQEVLNRVRKVLDGERRKLKEKEERHGKLGSAAAGPRKGG